MTSGEKTVILVRCDSLADAIRFVLKEPPERQGMFVYDAVWHSQRLQSSLDRALGTRDRLVDQVRKRDQGGN